MLHWLAMVSVMMRPTMQTATMTVGSAVDQTFPVSDLAFFMKNFESKLINPFWTMQMILRACQVYKETHLIINCHSEKIITNSVQGLDYQVY